MADDEPIIIGDWGPLLARQRTRKSGKQYATFEVQTDGSFMFDLSHAAWQPTADAIAEGAKEALRASSRTASASSLGARERAKTAYNKGESWAKKEYSGGRIGPTPPQGRSAIQYGIHSGRLIKSLAMRYVPSIASFVMNTASNRFGPEFVARQPAFVRWFGERIMEGMKSDKMQKGVGESINRVVTLVKDGGAAARKRLMDNARALADAARGLANEAGQEFGETDEQG